MTDEFGVLPPIPRPLCRMADCGTEIRARGLCSLHYERYKRSAAWVTAAEDAERIFCACPEPRAFAGPLRWSGPLPCECLTCGLPVYAAVIVSLGGGRVG